MTLADALQDEFSLGYRGRLMAINFHTKPARMIRELRLELNQHSAPEASLLAMASHLRTQDFVRKHTLIPLFRTVLNSNCKIHIPHGDPSGMDIIKSSAMIPIRKGAYFCPACVNDDCQDGFSYWRRTHQLPGIDWCIKHQAPLLMAQSIDAFHFTPKDALERSVPATEDRTILDSAVLQRYAHIVVGFLNYDRPISIPQARTKLVNKAKEVGLHISFNRKQSVLCAEALGLLPKQWLHAHFPNIDKNAPTIAIEEMTTRYRNLSASALAALFLAVFFDSADAALAYWAEPPSE